MKKCIRDTVLRGAVYYLCAGEKSIERIKENVLSDKVYPYYFSSLSLRELSEVETNKMPRNNTIMVVGQYLSCKGLDVALRAALLLKDYRFKIIGVGKKYVEFMHLVVEIGVSNVDVIPYLSKEELINEYMSNQMLVLPSRQECWGLVINEGATYGIPIISTYGSGAAVEFLSDKYSEFLAVCGDHIDLAKKICLLASKSQDEKNEYSIYLSNKAKEYSIERMVEEHLRVLT